MRVIDFAPPPTSLPELSQAEGRQLSKLSVQQATGSLPGASVLQAVKDSQREGMAILPALRAGDYKGAGLAFIRSTTAALGAIPEVHALPAFAGIISAYHGSPHTFDEFSLEKVGTGEGAQAYGHGLYFAENPGTAKSYQEGLSRGKGAVFSGDQPFEPKTQAETLARNALRDAGNDPKLQSMWFNQTEDMTRGRYAPFTKDDVAEAKRIADGLTVKEGGALYHVDLDVKPEELLDWDKPLSQQAPGVVEKLKGLGVKLDSRPGDDVIRAEIDRLEAQQQAAGTRHPVVENDIGRLRALLPDPTGGEIYESSKLVPGKYSDPAAASAALHAAGIPGIKYLDQGSRAAGDGTSNFVIFDPSVIAMVSRNGQPLVSSADKARDGLAVLAHPDAWQPGGAK